MGRTCSITTDTKALFERFPHLARIELIWGSIECRSFLAGLLTTERNETRQGFPPEHARTIFSLLTEHDENFPECERATERPARHDFYHRSLRR